MKRNLVIIISTALLLGYLATSRSMWLSDWEKQAAIGKDRLYKSVDLEKPGKILWHIPEDQWKYTGEVHVALELDNSKGTIPSSAFNKETMSLRIVMDANAIIYEPTGTGKKEVLRANRLIRNWYFTTNEPLSPKARMWESGGSGRYEFGLCGVKRYPWEDTFIEIDILQPDPTLAKANPRLVVYGDYDYAVYEHLGVLKILRDIILLFLAWSIVVIAYYAMKPKSNQAP